MSSNHLLLVLCLGQSSPGSAFGGPLGCQEINQQEYVTLGGQCYGVKHVKLPSECCDGCSKDPKCKAYQYYKTMYGAQCNWLNTVPSLRACHGYQACIAGKSGSQPAPKPKPKPKPKPRPKHAWPVFTSASKLQQDPWGAYFKSVYGELPSEFPLDVQDFWMLYDNSLLKAKVNSVPPIVGKCPGKSPPAGLRYSLNNIYSPADASWIWHPYPWTAFPAKGQWYLSQHR